MAQLVFHNKGFRAVRTARKVQEDLFRRAQRVAGAAGFGFVAVRTENPRNRARAAVVAASEAAKKRNARENTLLRSLDRGR